MRRVLLDENLPKGLARELGSVDVSTVHDQGWTGVSNGELLKCAGNTFDVLVTADQNLQYQQNLQNAPLGVVVVAAASTRLADLRPLIEGISDAIERVEAGEVMEVGL